MLLQSPFWSLRIYITLCLFNSTEGLLKTIINWRKKFLSALTRGVKRLLKSHQEYLFQFCSKVEQAKGTAVVSLLKWHNNCGWTRLKPGTKTQFKSLTWVAGIQPLEPAPAAFQGLHYQEAGSQSQSQTWASGTVFFILCRQHRFWVAL